MARIGIQKAEQEESIEILKWLDRTLIRLVAKFASYKKDDPSSFRLPQEFQFYPQFMYHLRRSHFITTFGLSPDETTFYRVLLDIMTGLAVEGELQQCVGDDLAGSAAVHNR